MSSKPRHKILRRAKSNFSDFVGRQSQSKNQSLPLTHLTDAYEFREIVADREIKPQYCTVFDSDLSYYFYGRPAYRKNGDVQANNITAYAPIVLVLKPELISEGSVVFPFDSGGFKADKYADFTHHKMRVEDFGLSSSFESVGQLVAFYYGTNEKYYDQIPRGNISIPAGEFEAQAFKDVICSPGKNARGDDRSSTIEIILDKAIKIDNNILALVVPASLLSDKKNKARLKEFSSHVLPYRDGASLTPASQIPRLGDIVRRFYIQKRLLT